MTKIACWRAPRFLLVLTLAVVATGCAVGQRKAQFQEILDFDRVDTDADGTVSRAEWDRMKAELQSLRRR